MLSLLQAKALGDVLVVGLIPDREILRCKGPPVLNERERYLLVDAVKWVDEVLQGEWAGQGPGFGALGLGCWGEGVCCLCGVVRGDAGRVIVCHTV